MPHSNIFFSQDTGAAVLDDQPGSLVNVLDQALVLGGASIAVASITRSGSTATVTFAAPTTLVPSGVYPLLRRMVFAGADQPEYNVEAMCTIVDALTCTFEVTGTPATPATTSTALSSKLASMGWTIAFTGTNRRVYQQGTGSNGFFLDVDDTYGQYARVRGYETATGLSAGSGLFPTAVQVPLNVGCWSKTIVAGAQPWVVHGNSKLVRFFTGFDNGRGANGMCFVWFGDVESEHIADSYNTAMVLAPSITLYNIGNASNGGSVSQIGANLPGMTLARAPNGIGSAVSMGQHSDYGKNPNAAMGLGSIPYPPPNGGLYSAPVYAHTAPVPRGLVPGIRDPLHLRPLVTYDTVTGTIGDTAGKQFMAVSVLHSASFSAGQVLVELTPW